MLSGGLVAAAAVVALLPAVTLAQLDCALFETVYPTGADIPKMWGDAFRYVAKGDPEYDLAYTMWWFDSENPNDAVTSARLANDTIRDSMNITDIDQCHLGHYYGNAHYDTPQTEGNDFTECHPWVDNACCTPDTVKGAAFKFIYGQEWAWDNCGKLTAECERFFVQEGCFYECDVNVGLFRKFHELNGNCEVQADGECADDHEDTWVIEAMPVKGDYFDAMWTACKGNRVCGGNNEECKDDYLASIVTQSPTLALTPSEGLSGAQVFGYVVLGLLLLGLSLALCRVISKERAGDPMFAPLSKPSDGAGGREGMNSFEQEGSNVAHA